MKNGTLGIGKRCSGIISGLSTVMYNLIEVQRNYCF